jgi:F-type H+-transporting ATPase subunit delta
MNQSSSNSSGSGSEPVNPGQQQVAAIYAKAFLGAAQTAGKPAELVEELAVVVREVLDRFPQLETLLGSALVGQDDKNAQLDRVFGPQFSSQLVDFLKVVARHGRLDVLRAIQREVQRQYDELRGLTRVRVITATPIDAQLESTLTESLRKMLGSEPDLQIEVEPELIGGLVLRVGDTVYDGSVQRQLAQLREQMINRSVHEIQSRRDSFRNPSGN